MSEIRFDTLRLDAAEFGSQGSAVLGIRDSGKTYTATCLAEKMFDAGVPFIAFDPIGIWRYLRVPGTGKGAKGYPIVVAGGMAGDLPLTPASAPMIVEAAMREGVSLVIDLFHMELSKAAWRLIVKDCIKLLVHKNKPHGLRHIFLEEAAEFCPQDLKNSGAGDVYAEIEKLARMGGNSRLGYTLINQRSQQVNKAVLELCDNLFLHRQKGVKSIENLKKWLEIAGAEDSKAVIASMATLPQGECWAWVGGSDRPIRIHVPQKRSFHPDRRVMRGDDEVTSAKAVDVNAFVAALQAALPKLEAETAENDPKKLKAKIAELQRQLKAAPVNPEALATARAEGHREGVAEGWAAGHREGFQKGGRKGYTDGMRRGIEALALLEKQGPEVDDAPPAPRPPSLRAPSPTKAAPPPRALAAARAAHEDYDGLSGPEKTMLGALAFWARLGKHQPDRAMVAAVCGWRITSGHIKNVSSSLRTKGLIDYPSAAALALTSDGAAQAPEPPNGSPADLMRRVLDGPQKAVVDLLERQPQMNREAICDALGWSTSSGHIKNVLSSLRTLQVIDYLREGVIAIEPWVFETA